MFQWSIKDVSCKFHEKEVSRVFQESFRSLSRMLSGSFFVSFKGISKKFWEWFKEVLELFIWSFHGVLIRKFLVCCKNVLVCFKEVSGVCWEHFKSESRQFWRCFRSVFKVVWRKLQRSFKAISRDFPEGFK